MKRIFFLSFFCLCLPAILHAQNIKFFNENKPKGCILYASNTEWYPVSVNLELDLTNMNFSQGSKTLFVVPAKTEKFKIGELTASEVDAAYKFSYRSRFMMGDVSLTSYDKSFGYDCPSGKEKAINCSRGIMALFLIRMKILWILRCPKGEKCWLQETG